jgi:hypothetical protein
VKTFLLRITTGLFYLYEMLPLEIKQSGGKLLPIRISGRECLQREYLEVLKSGKGHSGRYMGC